jgi:hypothetical protein
MFSSGMNRLQSHHGNRTEYADLSGRLQLPQSPAIGRKPNLFLWRSQSEEAPV